ncbi:MAG TPA: sensor histidine kinase [Rectinemataceae bacterium]|nr:sensor histidine kinase [Rectinemataceae bacterium]
MASGVLCVLFAMQGQGRASFVCCALFATDAALRTALGGDVPFARIFPEASLETLARLKAFSAHAAPPLAALFLAFHYPHEGPGILGRQSGRWAVAVAGLAFVVTPVFAPSESLVVGAAYWLVDLCSLGLAGLILGKALERRRLGGLAILIGGLAAAAAAIVDLIPARFEGGRVDYLPYGLALLFGTQVWALVRRLCGILDDAKAGSAELAEVNRRLEERLQSEAEIRSELEALVAEKELLLREVHHRVKNSLQIVSSIISLQSHRPGEEGMAPLYISIRNRLRAISLVHEKLFGLAADESVDLAAYARELLGQLAQSYEPVAGEGMLSLSLEHVQVPTDLCVDLGLILTELVANSYLHAVIPQGGGRVRVGLGYADGMISAEVSDDGPGFASGLPTEGGEGRGFQTALKLARRRGGDIELLPSRGARLMLRVPFEPCSTGWAKAGRAFKKEKGRTHE